MNITYIGHSGFMAELPHTYLLFDVLADEKDPGDIIPGGNAPEDMLPYSIGRLPAMDPEKDILVFASHSHLDHYSPNIWKLRQKYPHVYYILSDDIPLSAGSTDRPDPPEADIAGSTDRCQGTPGTAPGGSSGNRILRVRADQTCECRSAQILTLPSTDEGVAFLVTCEGKTLFHAGDLNLWLWEEEGAEYMRQMKQDFDRAVRPLAGRKADVAFLPLDGRLEEHAYDGMDAFLRVMSIDHVFPMHFWKQYDLIPSYIKDRPGIPAGTRIHTITRENQSFAL